MSRAQSRVEVLGRDAPKSHVPARFAEALCLELRDGRAEAEAARGIGRADEVEMGAMHVNTADRSSRTISSGTSRDVQSRARTPKQKP